MNVIVSQEEHKMPDYRRPLAPEGAINNLLDVTDEADRKCIIDLPLLVTRGSDV